MKSSQTISVRRTSSLHINNPMNLSNSFVKSSNSHHDQLTDSSLDLSRMNPQRRSMRNTEKFSGIKCSLPSTKATMPHTFKGLEKHTTPTKNSSSAIVRSSFRIMNEASLFDLGYSSHTSSEKSMAITF